MAMIQGTVVVDPLTGSVGGSGLALEVFTVLEAGQDFGGLTGPSLAAAKEQLAVIARAVAVVVPHIQINALVTTTVATAIPVAVTPSTGIGATTSPGTGTGSVS